MSFFSPTQHQPESYPLVPLPSPSQPPPQKSMSSIYLSPWAPQPSNSTTDTLLSLSRQSTHLQQTLQSLLDAQSAGLSAGLGHPPPSSPAQQPRPLSSSRQSDKRHPSPLPSRCAQSATSRTSDSHATPTLSDARSGIYSTLLSLAQTKTAEAAAYTSTLSSHSVFLANTRRLETKRSQLQQEISALESGPELTELAELRGEEEELRGEIRVLEEELAVKKARLRDVGLRVERAGNRHEARLSSWRQALEGVQSEVEGSVLEGRGLGGEAGPGARGKGTGRGGGEEGVWALPRDRRTVEMVREGVEAEVGRLEELQGGAEREGEACAEGAETWKACVRVVGRVERALRREMVRLRGGPSLLRSRRESMGSETSGSDVAGENGSPAEGMQGVLQRMDAAVTELGEKHLPLATEKGWNPIMLAIEAELEALVEGREVLESAFGLSQGNLDGLSLNERNSREEVMDDAGKGKEPLEDDRGSKLVDLSHEHEDGPSPDLLVSHTDE